MRIFGTQKHCLLIVTSVGLRLHMTAKKNLSALVFEIYKRFLVITH